MFYNEYVGIFPVFYHEGKLSMIPANQYTYTNNLNIAAYSSLTYALGPGKRAVVWVQGCPFNCPGCIAPAWIPFADAHHIAPEDLLPRLFIEEKDGLTFSGGEPMMQAGSLARLARIARKIKDINLICFTGFRYERLLKNPPNLGVPELLSEVDVLIDGPYVQSKNDSHGLRGSANQRILHLSDRLRNYDLENQRRNVEISIRDGEFSFIGIPTPEVKKSLDQSIMAHTERIKK